MRNLILHTLLLTLVSGGCLAQDLEPDEIYQGVFSEGLQSYNQETMELQTLPKVHEMDQQQIVAEFEKTQDGIRSLNYMIRETTEVYYSAEFLFEAIQIYSKALFEANPSGQFRSRKTYEYKGETYTDPPLNKLLSGIDTIYSAVRRETRDPEVFIEIVRHAGETVKKVQRKNYWAKHAPEIFNSIQMQTISYYRDVIWEITDFSDNSDFRKIFSLRRDKDRAELLDIIATSYIEGFKLDERFILLACELTALQEKDLTLPQMIQMILDQYVKPIEKIRVGLSNLVVKRVDSTQDIDIETANERFGMALEIIRELDKRNEHHMHLVFDQMEQKKFDWTWENVRRILKLYEYYGILCFQRYVLDDYALVDYMIELAENPKANKKKKNALILISRQGQQSGLDIEGGIFSMLANFIDVFNQRDFGDLLDQLRSTHNVYIFEIASDKAIIEAAETFSKRSKSKADLVIIGGHGSPTSISLASDIFTYSKNPSSPSKYPTYQPKHKIHFRGSHAATYEESHIETSEDFELLKKLDKHLKKEAQIVLYSCDTGGIPEDHRMSIQTMFAKTNPGRLVLAPAESISGARLKLNSDNELVNVAYYIRLTNEPDEAFKSEHEAVYLDPSTNEWTLPIQTLRARSTN